MLSVHGLTRRFDDRLVVDDVSFTLPEAEMTGFLGANGAGKTTIMRLIMGLLAPHAGTICWKGQPIEPEVRRRIGYIPEERGLYPKQRIIDQLSYFGRLRGLSSRAAHAQVQDFLERFRLADRSKMKLETLSLGNQQRVQIIAALIGNPLMLVLDEPFSGLDPLAIDEMSKILSERASEGIPVFFSSHQIELIDRLCDRIVILSRGRVIAEGMKSELLKDECPVYRLISTSSTSWVKEVEGIEALRIVDNVAEFTVQDESSRRKLVECAIREGDIVELYQMKTTLGDAYRKMVTQ